MLQRFGFYCAWAQSFEAFLTSRTVGHLQETGLRIPTSAEAAHQELLQGFPTSPKQKDGLGRIGVPPLRP